MTRICAILKDMSDCRPTQFFILSICASYNRMKRIRSNQLKPFTNISSSVQRSKWTAFRKGVYKGIARTANVLFTCVFANEPRFLIKIARTATS